MTEPWVSVEDVAAHLGVAKDSVYRWIDGKGQRLIAPLDKWTQKEQTQAEVEVFILDHVFQALPTPPFTAEEKEAAAQRAYRHIWQQSAIGLFPKRKAA